MTIGTMYEVFTPRVMSTVLETYSLWDGNKTTSCVCDYGEYFTFYVLDFYRVLSLISLFA